MLMNNRLQQGTNTTASPCLTQQLTDSLAATVLLAELMPPRRVNRPSRKADGATLDLAARWARGLAANSCWVAGQARWRPAVACIPPTATWSCVWSQSEEMQQMQQWGLVQGAAIANASNRQAGAH